MVYQKLLSDISKQYRQLLGDNLIGIYVHGSIAFGCFNWNRSDIDFIVVVDTPLTQSTKQQLLKVLENLRHQSPPKGFEMSVVLRKYCETFVYPTPYELHFSNNAPNDYNTSQNGDYDLAAHFTVISNVGITLCGEPINKIFGDVPKQDYLDSIRKDVESAKDEVICNPIYIILNLCRVFAYIKESLVLSKEQGGQWGLLNLPPQYTKLVSSAMDNYVDGISFDEDKAIQEEFCKYMTNLIFTPINNSSF